MPPETNENDFIATGQANKAAINAAGQQAEKIVNVGTNVGDINIQAATFISNVTGEKKPVSMMLTRKLIEAIALENYSPRATNFLSKIKEAEKVDWESRGDNKYLSTAKGVIVSSYGSVLSSYISNIFGCENTSDYFNLSIAIVKRTLQLICFSFISSLWDQLENNKIQLTEGKPGSLTNFFNSQTELDISEYAQLFVALVALFQQHQVEYPFSEIKNKENEFREGGSFMEACKKMNDYAVRTNNNLPSIGEIENGLTNFLVSLNFLAAYKMISVKGIEYDVVRNNKSSQYLHSYTLLGINNEKTGSKYNYDEKPLNTDAILLYKNKYQDGINLFPFIIDYNALIDEQQLNICFFVGYEENPDEQDDNKTNKMVRYFDTNKISCGNDDKDIIIQFNEEIENAVKVKPNNDVVTRYKTEDNGNKFKALKKNEAFKAFERAKTIITD